MGFSRVNLIGAGRLGQTLGYLLAQSGYARLCSVWSRSRERAEAAVAWIGQGEVCDSFDNLAEADCYLITTKDDVIQPVCEQMNAQVFFPPGAIILHCSGALTSDVLASAKTQGTFIASAHPTKSVADPKTAIRYFAGTPMLCEGDPEALLGITPLLEAIGAILIPISKSAKIKCHIASVIASNYLITLAARATHCYQTAGLDETTARLLVHTLMKSSLQNLEQLPLEAALTGPLKRGDRDTLKRHLDALTHTPTQNLYRILAENSLDLLTLSTEKKAEIRALLDAYSESVHLKEP